MNKIYKKSMIFVFCLCFLLCLVPERANAASLKYKHNGKTITYKGAQPTVKFNNKKISLGKTPALLINDVAMVPYYETLVKAGPKVKKSYTSRTKTLTLTYNSNKIKMTVGKKTAYVNGKKVTLPVAPQMITYTSAKKTRILVPSRKVCEYLGMSYSWNGSTKTISITQKSSTTTSGLSIKYDGTSHTYTGVQAPVYVNGTKINSAMPALKISGVWYVPANAACNKKYGLGVSYSYKSKKVTLTDGTDTVIMTADSKNAVVNGTTKTMPYKCRRVYLKKNKTTYVMVSVKYISDLFDLSYSTSDNTITLKAAQKVYPSNIPETSNTSYGISLNDYASLEYAQLSDSMKKQVTLDDMKNYLDQSHDSTEGFQYLRLDVYRDMDTAGLNNLIASNSTGKKGILNGQAIAIDNAAKKYAIDPVAFAMQCIHETAWGTSKLAMGITKDEVAIPIYNSKKEITGFETEKDKDGKTVYKTVKLTAPVTAYNLFGIKAYDADPQLCGFSYAYYNGWTTIPAAIEGGAKYISDNYIHNTTYKQNTFFKFRFNPKQTYIWHQYATDPGYAQKIGAYLKTYKYLYGASATFQYDFPAFVGGF